MRRTVPLSAEIEEQIDRLLAVGAHWLTLQVAKPPRQGAPQRRARTACDMLPHANRRGDTPLTLHLPAELLEQIAERAAEILAERQADKAASPWLDVDEAALYLRCGSRQRIHDLVHACKLHAARDGRRLLFQREALSAYLAGGAA